MEFFDRNFARIHAAAGKVAARPVWDVLFVSHHPELFDTDEFIQYRSDKIRSVHFVADPESLRTLSRRFDIAIVCNSAAQEHVPLFAIRQGNICDFVFVWTFDNHHSERHTLSINPLGDVVIPSHRFAAAYMKSPGTVLGRHVPLSTSQWSRSRAAELFAQHLAVPRSNALQGTFLSHPGPGDERTKLARELQAGLSEHALKLIDQYDPDIYFSWSAERRWLDWASYKAGLILPVKNDLPIRFFDSLLTGQIPLVPEWCRDFDAVIPPDLQESLPVVRFREPSAEAVQVAWRKAIALFDKDGAAGVKGRHLFALQSHHVANRLEAICAQVLPIASGNLQLDMDTTSVGFILTD